METPSQAHRTRTHRLTCRRIRMRSDLDTAVQGNVTRHLEQHGIPMVDIIESVQSYTGNLFNGDLHYDAERNRREVGGIAQALRPGGEAWFAEPEQGRAP